MCAGISPHRYREQPPRSRSIAALVDRCLPNRSAAATQIGDGHGACQRRRGWMCGSLGSSGQLMPRSRGMRGLGTRPIKSMSGGASSAAWRSSASASLIQLTRRASASGSYGCSTSCPRGESRARTLGPRSRPVALAGGRRGTASAAPLPVRLLRSALASCGPSTCCRRVSRRAHAPCARPGS